MCSRCLKGPRGAPGHPIISPSRGAGCVAMGNGLAPEAPIAAFVAMGWAGVACETHVAGASLCPRVCLFVPHEWVESVYIFEREKM